MPRLLLSQIILFVGLSLAAGPVAYVPVLDGDKESKVSQAEAFIEKAKTAMQAKEYTKAEKLLNKAKRLNPDLPEVYRLLGDFHAGFNRDWKAKKYYKKAEELEKNRQASNEAKKKNN